MLGAGSLVPLPCETLMDGKSSMKCQITRAAGTVAFRVSHSTLTECLSQKRRREKRTQDDMFQEIAQACAASENETRAWRVTLAESMEKKRVEKRKAGEYNQEKKKEMHQDKMELLRQQTEMRWT
ncbi:unnamed protein product [Caretta caretta]